jgi:uncharacterized FAD-dependent dehydrogenase
MSLLTFSDIKLPISSPENELLKIAQKKLGAKAEYFEIKKKSLDARDKNNIKYVYTIACSKHPYQEQEEILERLPKHKQPQNPVLVVGSGPAGLFCALRLLARGIKPVVIERGAPVKEREKDTQTFFQTGKLNVESNVQFGEGGAGTFSDGKLNTQTHGAWNTAVLKTFVAHGAPEEIQWLQKPHIGSDRLKTVVKNMREYILAQGGQVRFYTRLKEITVKNGELTSAVLSSDRGEETLEVSALVLAIGHSARDTFQMLKEKGVYMRQKDFAVGVRIEHLQKDIGFAQYGKAYQILPAADYKLVSRGENGRSAFTFCMCPGGYVMPSSSEEGGVVTNGMSNYARDGVNANAALIAQVTGADFLSDDPLAGVEYQRKLERAAYLAGGENYRAPVQLVGDFLQGKESARFGEIQPTYAVGTVFADLNGVLPAPVCETLKTAIAFMDRKLKGFARSDAVLTGVETRTSSPLRIERNEKTLQSVSTFKLYPCGEGAGYSGGITSSAADGIRVADAVFFNFLQ